MSQLVQMGKFSVTTTGDLAVTGVGFAPKALLLFSVGRNGDGTSPAAVMGAGIAASATQEGSVSYRANDAKATSQTRGIKNNANVMHIKCSDIGGEDIGNLTSFDGDGFTINWDPMPVVPIDVFYIALAGTDLTNTFYGTAVRPTSTSAQSITGVGFKPDFVLFLTSMRTASETSAVNAYFGIGAMNNHGEQGSAFIFSQNGLDTTNSTRYARFTAAINPPNCMCTSSTVDNGVAAFTSMDSDGFTLQWFTPLSTDIEYLFLCLKGINSKIGTFLGSTATGLQEVEAATNPLMTLLVSTNDTVNATPQTHARLSVGAASSSSSRFSLWMGDQGVAGTSITDKDQDSAKVLKMLTEGTPTNDSTADFSAMRPSGFDVNWSAVDATAEETMYIALGICTAVKVLGKTKILGNVKIL